ncbi:hypothetical protein HY638_03245 [Candidatus Woesearchaeota archaeon]|nr:hypothetical protein [Candidatus Woesearchaeota archaeon]
MEKDEMFKLVKELSFDTKKVVYGSKDIEVYIFRPSTLSKRFEGYDKNKNFQIWLREGNREFRPNHMRVFIDLNLRIRSRPDLKKELLLAFDNIFYGKDPENELMNLSKESFEHYLNHLKVIGVLAQLFIIEQEYGYHKESKFEPPTLFFQGWIREFIDNSKEIDNLCMSVCNGQPALARYVKLENKKDKKHNPNLKPLWYLD